MNIWLCTKIKSKDQESLIISQAPLKKGSSAGVAAGFHPKQAGAWQTPSIFFSEFLLEYCKFSNGFISDEC